MPIYLVWKKASLFQEGHLMGNRGTAKDPFNSIWKFFTSVRLTVVLLLTLAATSIIGTLIPQNEAPRAYIQAFGPALYRFFELLGFLDLYHSWWFQTLMLLLALNILVCSIDRLCLIAVTCSFSKHSTSRLIKSSPLVA